MLVKNRKFSKKQKFWSKIVIFPENRKLIKLQILVKIEKLNFTSEIEILFENGNNPPKFEKLIFSELHNIPIKFRNFSETKKMKFS